MTRKGSKHGFGPRSPITLAMVCLEPPELEMRRPVGMRYPVKIGDFVGMVVDILWLKNPNCLITREFMPQMVIGGTTKPSQRTASRRNVIVELLTGLAEHSHEPHRAPSSNQPRSPIGLNTYNQKFLLIDEDGCAGDNGPSVTRPGQISGEKGPPCAAAARYLRLRPFKWC